MRETEQRTALRRIRLVGHGIKRFVELNVQQLLVDAIAVLGWLFVLTLVFQQIAWPRWAFYLLLFVGIFVYSELAEGWTFPGDEA